MNKHSPGPWYQSGEDVLKDIGDHSFAIATAADWSEETEPNARLIAAAPELLEACQTFAEWLRREDVGFVQAGNSRETPEGESAWRDWYHENLRICALAQEQARAAIAKATGEPA